MDGQKKPRQTNHLSVAPGFCLIHGSDGVSGRARVCDCGAARLRLLAHEDVGRQVWRLLRRTLSQRGKHSTLGDEKRAYGNSFGIIGLVQYYKLTADPNALALAKNCFEWMEKYDRDKTY